MAKRLKNPESAFGVPVGTVLILIAAALMWRGRIGRAEIVGGVGAALLILGLVQPRLLKWPSTVWWRFSAVLGYINARIILTILFTFVLIPLSMLWRILGTDPLARRRDRFSGWSAYPERYRDPTHYQRMF